MVDLTALSFGSDDSRRPQFRRGWTPQDSGYVPIHYRALRRVRADRAWRELVKADWAIKKAPVIAGAMGAGRETAARCRRVFDALDLLDNIPGSYNLDAVDDWESNIPAVVRLHTRDPEAFLRAVAHDQDLVFFVSSRHAPGQSIEDWRQPSSLRSSGWERQPRPTTVWVAEHGPTGGLPQYLVEQNGSRSGEQVSYSSTKYAPNREPFGEWIVGGPPPMVVLAKDDRGQLGAKRRAPTSRLLTRQGTEGIGPRDVMEEFGFSLATAKRLLDRWMEEGLCRRVGRGRYVLVGRVK